MRPDFCVFILSHGRAKSVHTAKTLKACGYTGKTYIVCDNEDDSVGEYIDVFGEENVLVFDKLEMSKRFDTADTSEDRRTIVYARNACFDLAKKVGCKYFLELDDDYVRFEYRHVVDGKLKAAKVKQADRLFEGMVELLESANALTVAFMQGGDFIGGAESTNYKRRMTRKAMNTFFCSVERPFNFVGRINEDVNTYTWLGSRGELFFSIADASITQKQTQANKGGMTDVYLDSGTYVKSFYSVIFMPSCVKIKEMGDKHKRIHHSVDWEACVPKILNEKHKK